MSLNRVLLIGQVMAPPQLRAADIDGETNTEILLGIVRSGRQGDVVDRILVRLSAGAEEITDLLTGATVFVSGELRRDGALGRYVVIAQQPVVLVAPPSPLSPTEVRGSQAGTHASPVEHVRAGHWRKLGVGTDKERQIWISETVVKPTGIQGSTGREPSVQ